MTFSTRIFKTSWTREEIEFLFLAAWLLLFPGKGNGLYLWVSAILVATISLQRILSARTLAFNSYTALLFCFNFSLILGAFFSPSPWKSAHFCANLLGFSLFFLFWESPIAHPRRCILWLGLIISLSSAGTLLHFAFHSQETIRSPFFYAVFLQSIASGAAAIICLHFFIERTRFLLLLPLSINLLVLLLSPTFPVFLGTLATSFLLLLLSKRSWIPFLLFLGILFLVIPSTTRQSLTCITRLPLAENDRLQTWKMSFKMALHHPWVGVGPDLFPEKARQFNYPHRTGLSRFGNVPRSPRNDFIGFMCYLGIIGAIGVILFLWVSLRTLWVPPRFDVAKALLLYFLLQFMTESFVFEPFFLIVFLFTMKALFEAPSHFFSPSISLKTIFASLAIMIFLFSTLLPTAANVWLRCARQTKNPEKAFHFLAWAERFNPINAEIPMERGLHLFRRLGSDRKVEDGAMAIAEFRRAQSNDPFLLDALLGEAETQKILHEMQFADPGMLEEIVSSLVLAEKIDPFNPFVKLQKAKIYLQFADKTLARSSAEKALEIEPDFVAALCFLHDHFAYLDDAAFTSRLRAIEKKRRDNLSPKGSYLDRLFASPKN